MPARMVVPAAALITFGMLPAPSLLMKRPPSASAALMVGYRTMTRNIEVPTHKTPAVICAILRMSTYTRSRVMTYPLLKRITERIYLARPAMEQEQVLKPSHRQYPAT